MRAAVSSTRGVRPTGVYADTEEAALYAQVASGHEISRLDFNAAIRLGKGGAGRGGAGRIIDFADVLPVERIPQWWGSGSGIHPGAGAYALLGRAAAIRV